MKGEEFKQKMLKLKEQFEDILYKIEDWDAYIYQQKFAEQLHWQVKKHILELKYYLEQYELGNTTESYHDKLYGDFCRFLQFDKNGLSRFQKEADLFIAPR